MQSTGQGSTHRSQPVHSLPITVCMCLAAPRIASTGQAWIHLVQPMHSSSRMTATRLACSTPCSASSGCGSTSSRSARALIVLSPPGGHLLMASPLTMTSASGRQPGKPHWPHWVCGSRESISSTRGLPSTLNLTEAKPSSAPNTRARVSSTTTAIRMLVHITTAPSDRNQAGETQERQRHEAGSNHADRGAAESHRHIGNGYAFAHGGKQHQYQREADGGTKTVQN